VTTTMYDTQYPEIVPSSAGLVVSYPDGPAGNSYATAQRLFGNRALSISWTGVDAQCADIEQWSSFPLASLPAWIKRQHARGIARPVIYAIYAGLGTNYPQVKALVGSLSVSWWLSDWTGKPHALPGADAVQYGAQASPASPVISDPGKAGGRTYDLSLVQPTFPFYPSIFPLQVGSTGEWVTKLQANLNKRASVLGLPVLLSVDGSFGPLTEIAVIKAQAAYHQPLLPSGACSQRLFELVEFQVP
jgi:hypothetical protein